MDKDENNQFSCEKCQYVTDDKSNYMKHLKTNRHNRTSLVEPRKYVCEPCSFITTSRGNHARHLNTQKHKIITRNTTTSKSDGFECHVCGKGYSHRPSLSRHLKTCKPVADEPTKMLGMTEEKIFQIIQQAINKPSTNNTNCHNKTTFNLQMFLNNDCKDAITLIEFVSTIHLKLKDLEDTAQHGFVDTMTSIMTESLKELDVTQRPIHSTDLKRGVMYVKDKTGWEKDTGNTKMAAAINKVSNSNMRQLADWVKENPEANNAGTSANDHFMKILEHTVNDDEVKHANDIDKVIKKVAKTVTIDR
jgi:hypothetical protein